MGRSPQALGRVPRVAEDVGRASASAMVAPSMATGEGRRDPATSAWQPDCTWRSKEFPARRGVFM